MSCVLLSQVLCLFTMEHLVSVCVRLVSPRKWPQVQTQGETRAIVSFEDGSWTETSTINACRALLADKKLHWSTKRWTALEPYELGVCENIMRIASTSHGASLFGSLSERLGEQTDRFLVDSEAVTLADLVALQTLKKLDQAKKLTDSTAAAWMRFASQMILTPAVTSCPNGRSSDVPTSDAVCATSRSPKSSPTRTGEAPTSPQGRGEPAGSNFIKQIIEEDIRTGKHTTIVTRFPPEPNGFLHLGHAKSICLNFGLARTYGGRCHLRFDDTNPAKEDMRFIASIEEDVRWLGGDWGSHLYFASDYFQQLNDWAVQLIEQGDAYVDYQTEEEVRVNRGDVTRPGVNSPYRDRSVQENLEIFEKMRQGEIPEGTCIVRAKIDMTHGNMNMRDPPIYRVRFHPHPRTGDKWKVYPIYDFAHGQSDSIEHITHSICTLEFEDHRPLYEWFQEKLGIFKTRQIEFARLNCTYVVISKRYGILL